MQTHANCGALGVRMVNGKGEFLKESKRGFPGVVNSFCKMSGLSRLFPKSGLFAGYYLGHLPERETHAVDVLCGAFMMVRRELLEKTGGFDERYFMYGEDIDLSYQINLSGYRNYYFPEVTITHYKGESTNKKKPRVFRPFLRSHVFIRKEVLPKRVPDFRVSVPVGRNKGAMVFQPAFSSLSSITRQLHPFHSI